jgi:predicted GNAT family acetyltransferase/glutaredoxin
VLTLYQAEWCPFSSAVREILTELGLDFAARQVEPWPEQRERLQQETGADEIPTLVTEDGRSFSGTREIFSYLRTIDGWEHRRQHRRFLDHEPARESDAVGQLVGYFEPTASSPPDGDPEVVDVPEESRYELRTGGETVGLAAYRMRGENRIVFLHTEVDDALEGRGLGSTLAAAALDDARRRGLAIVPLCPFISRYIEGHPEYQDAVAAGYGPGV